MEIGFTEDDVWWVITMLDMYGTDLQSYYSEETEKRNQKLIRILNRAITTYPKKYLISSPLKEDRKPKKKSWLRLKLKL